MKLTKTRPGITFILCSAALFIAMLAMPALPQAENIVQFKIGVLANSGKEQCLRQWKETARYLADKIPGASFGIIPLDFREAVAAVKNRELDFIIANPSIYVDLEVRYDAQPIATMKNQMSGRSFNVFGGVIFTGADRSDINSLNDLRNKRFMAVDPDSFGGWLAAWRELKDHGIDPFRDFTEMKFSGTQDAVVDAVKRGDVDAGTIRTNTLEHLMIAGKIDFKDFKLINPVTAGDYNDQSFPLWLSTRLYPEWPLAKLKHTSLDLAEKVCVALLAMPSDDPAALTGRYNGWTVPLNYQPVHECLKELRYKPYEDFGRVTFRDVLKKYWLLLLATAILIVIMMFTIYFVVTLNRKLQQSQIKLKKEEENLRRSEQTLRSIIDESAEGIVLTDEQGMIVEWNMSIEQISGVKRADVIGRALWDVQFQMALKDKKTPEAYERLKTMLTGLLKTGEAPLLRQPVDWNIQHPDGMQRVVQTVTFPINLGHGFMIVGFLLDITERKAAEQQLTATKEYLENIITSSLDAIIVNDSAQNIAQCNRYFLELIGYTEDEVLGKHVYEFTPTVGKTYESTSGDTVRITDDFYNDTITMIGRLLETGKAANWQTYYLCKNGKVVPVEQNSFMLRDKQGNSVGAASIIRDISERKQAEKQIKTERDRAQQYLDIAGVTLVALSTDQTVILINKRGCTLLGYAEEEIIGKKWFDTFLPERSRQKVKSLFANLISGQVLPHEYAEGLVITKNGKERLIAWHNTLLKDKEGTIVGTLSSGEDITERNAAERQMRETNDYLDNIIESSLDAIVISDNVGRITRCNRAFLNLVGCEKAEIIGTTMLAFVPIYGEEYESTTGEIVDFQDDFYNEQTAMVEKIIETGMLSNWQTYLACKNNKVVPVEENIVYLLDKEGKRIGAVGIIRDITERRRIETERERLIAELQKALVQVKTLSGFIPICSSCKKVRNDSGYWEQVEAYIGTHSEAEFSHSICPDCAQKLYPEIYAKISKDT